MRCFGRAGGIRTHDLLHPKQARRAHVSLPPPFQPSASMPKLFPALSSASARHFAARERVRGLAPDRYERPSMNLELAFGKRLVSHHVVSPVSVGLGIGSQLCARRVCGTLLCRFPLKVSPDNASLALGSKTLAPGRPNRYGATKRRPDNVLQKSHHPHRIYRKRRSIPNHNHRHCLHTILDRDQ
jgi:hypothetical protein